MSWFRSYEAKCVQVVCFAGVDLFALKFYLDRVVPSNHFLQQETRDARLHAGEDLCILSLWHNTGV